MVVEPDALVLILALELAPLPIEDGQHPLVHGAIGVEAAVVNTA